jgi:hypothetical protein
LSIRLSAKTALGEAARGNRQSLERTISSQDEALAWRAGQVDALEKAKIELLNSLQAQAEKLQGISGELGLRNQELAEIHMSRGWRAITKLRAIRDTLRRTLGG